MNIFNFTDVEDNDKEYKYKILVYPNITFQKDLEKDSYVVVLCNIIKELNKIRDDLFFTIISPAHINSLEFENTQQIIAPQISYPNSMRMAFPYKEVFAGLKWKENDYDIVYSHLPEHTGNLKNLLYNSTNISPAIIGYTHWTEFKEITNYEYQVGLAYNIVGLLQMSKCGINTQAQKDLVLKNAKEYFNDDVIKKLDDILEPHYLGWEIPKYEKQTTEKKIIVYNHRPHTYKNYPWFLEQMDKLWEQRKDFEVWVPLADGMSVGVPYLFSDDGSYHELADYAGVYYEDGKQFLEKMNVMLDDKKVRDTYSERSLKRFDLMKWENAIHQFNFMINETIDGLPMLKEDTDSYNKVVDFIHKKKSVTKKQILEHLGWGVRISFSGYRNRLRTNPTIKFTKNRYEVI